MSFSSSINLSSLNGSTGFRLDGVSAFDASGSSVASAGDVNGDGFADLIIGAIGADPNSNNFSGSSYVAFGKASGFTSAIDLSSLNGTTGFRLDGVASLDFSGWSVASAGDVNGDGFADLIIGANGADPNGSDSGSSYVLFGKASGFTSAINLSSLNGTTGFRLDGVAADDDSGVQVATAGDVNGDGFADLIIGANEADPNGSRSGSSYVVFGKASGFTSAINLSSLNGTTGFRLDGVAANDDSGASVASAGDVNGDGFADLIIGAPLPPGPFITGSGTSYVVFGKASGFTSAINLSSLNGTTGFRLNGVADEDQTGCSVASAGDVNGDGFADLIVGARWADPNGGNSGSTYVVFGKSSGFTAAINLASLDGTSGFRLDGVTTGDGSGKSVAAAGDVNGDGFADLIVGADGADPNSNNSSGSSYIIFGKAGVFAASVDLSSLNGSTGFRLDGVAANDGSGYAVASAGDVNGDGRADLVIGADSAAPNGNLRAGSSYVYFSPASGGATYRGTTLADRLSGTTAGDTINGYSGNDILNGNAGDDTITAGTGNDTITGGTGNDTIDGGAGNDTVKWAPGDGNDTVTLGTGTNTIDFDFNAYIYVDSGTQRVFTIGSATVTVVDWTTGTNSVVRYNQAPSISGSASFAENATGTAYTATGTDPNSDPLTYTLGGVDAGLFNINTTSGAVTFKASPDFEAPADAGANNVYDITVTASDGSLSSAAQAVAITVTNVNEAPSITSGGSASFAENATGTVYTATGSDPEGAALTFTLGGTDAGLFNINSSTGVVTFKAAPDFDTPGDAGANNVYDITVTASDGSLSSAAKAVAITVTNVNEAPSITSGATASFAENATGAVYTATGSDPEGAALTFTLGGTDAALFNINTSSGALTFKAAPDFNAPADTGANNVYDITVTASDGSLSCVARPVAITLTASQQLPPVNQPPAVTSPTTASFAENATGTVYTATGSDPEGVALTFTLGGTDAGLLNINSSTGVVTFKAAPDFDTPGDAGANNVYDITVTASDGSLSSAAQGVAITVTNVNQAPSITSGGSASFAENATGTVYTATGTDPDANTPLTYALGGVDAARFNINTTSGVVTFTALPDFEAPADAGANNVYDITVTASDGSLSSAAQAVAITVTDVVEFKIGQGNGSSTDIKAEPYTGPVAGIEYQVIAGGSNDIIIGSDRADFMNAGMGNDAIDGGAGNDVIDGGLGSNFISGGAGRDGFFLDGRAAVASTTWSTLTDFSPGEQVTIWGYKPGVSKFLWVASDGAEGYKGATLHCDLDGNGVIDTSVTFTGMAQAQLPTPSFGTVQGNDYIFFG